MSRWLHLVAALVALTILLGGWTRLTDSGLSITEWQLFSGLLPPLSAQEWNDAFADYRQTAEYRLEKAGMDLPAFKRIYWWEWLHRMVGRIVGVAYGVPFLWLALRRAIPAGWGWALTGLFALGATQGAIGWWMVQSGLAGDRVDVAPLRLAIHLGLAFALFGALLHAGLSLRQPAWLLLQARRHRVRSALRGVRLVLFLLFAQILLGALVAGIDAGKAYADWPLIGGEIWPSEALALSPWWMNLTENPALAQFLHRMAGYVALLAVFFLWRATRHRARPVRRWGNALLHGALLQVALGVGTVLYGVPAWLALTHQAGAVLLFAMAVLLHHALAYPQARKIGSVEA